ncbi:MAG: hypothetical protein MUD17_11545 [Gemmatimonadaceae bacterium]|nr:hypothetical protein [Gemmatimonadaceae bacterium]
MRQSAIQRLLRMSELRVETATQGLEAEVTLSVLPWGAAQALREQLVAERRRALDTVRVGTDAAPDAASSPAAEHANASLSATVTDAPAPRIMRRRRASSRRSTPNVSWWRARRRTTWSPCSRCS